MCYELYHECRFCKAQYECNLPNYVCPTINSDVDRNMCDSCRAKEQEDFKKWLENESNGKSVSLDDWENNK